MYKQYILVRGDTYFPTGKIMAHCSHNAVTNFYVNAMDYDMMTTRFDQWYNHNDMTTIVLYAKSLKDIYEILNKAEEMEIPTSFIKDIHSKKRICAVVGPVTDDEAKELGLKKLKLY